MTATSALPGSATNLKRCEEPPSLRLNTRATKRPRTESHRGVSPQQDRSPTPGLIPSSSKSSVKSSASSDQFKMPAPMAIKVSGHRKRGQYADMCGQFEDLVGVRRPHRERSSLPMPQSIPVAPAAGNKPLLNVDRYDQMRAVDCQQPMVAQPFNIVPLAMDKAKQNDTTGQIWHNNTSPHSLYQGMHLDENGSLTLDPYSLDLDNDINATEFFMLDTLTFPQTTLHSSAAQQPYIQPHHNLNPRHAST